MLRKVNDMALIFKIIDQQHEAAKIPGGWIVKARTKNLEIPHIGVRSEYGIAMCFVPDEHHKWNPYEQPEVKWSAFSKKSEQPSIYDEFPDMEFTPIFDRDKYINDICDGISNAFKQLAKAIQKNNKVNKWKPFWERNEDK
jgi:hypothetical protein